MSPPIRDGSGNSIGSIRLGDGSEISEVRTGAGDVLFSAIPDSGVTRLTFDDADTSGTATTDIWGSNDGTITGATTGQSGVSTTYDSAESFEFAESGDTVVSNNPIPSSVSGNTSKSFALWFYQTDYSSTGGLFLMGIGGDDGEKFGLFRNTGSDGGLVRWGESAEFDHPFGTTTSLNTAYHVVCVYDSSASESRVYLNGSEDASAKSMTLNTGQTSFKVSTNERFTNGFSGRIDDVRIYNKALSDSEVSNLYNSGSING